MQTEICEITKKSLEQAKTIIENGGVVAFPTETVYGLGADARRDDAVSLIFNVKGRPSDNPLIAHIHKDYDLSELVYDDKPYAKILRDRFLPGPLTMVYRSKGKVSSLVSCGLDTLAIRVPSHKGAQEFLKYVDMPIAAPSANISKHVSPVTAEHVLNDFNGKIPLILQGGACDGGIESTVLDVTGDIPVILRAGLVSQEMIIDAVGKCDLYIPKQNEKVRSPGMKYKHYSPNCRTCIFDYTEIEQAKKLYNLEIDNNPYIMCEDIVAENFKGYNLLNLGKTPLDMAKNLYYKLREGEKVAGIIIAIEPKEKDGVMQGVLNRFNKACHG